MNQMLYFGKPLEELTLEECQEVIKRHERFDEGMRFVQQASNQKEVERLTEENRKLWLALGAK